MIPLKVHNVVDYLMGSVLIVSPWLFDFAQIPAARTLFLIGGIALIAYSLLTNYYFSVVRVVPLGIHMTLDTILGVFLILAPAIFSYRNDITQVQSIVHLVLGLSTVALVGLTRPRTEASKTAVDRATLRNDLPITR